MPPRTEIKSEKILVKKIFSNMWFRIPEYQRPYIWGSEQVNDLLDDLSFAMTEKPDSEYFLGSFVFQFRSAGSEKDQEFDENDLLDGQQRMTTILILFAVIRDLAEDLRARKVCHECIYQEASKYKNIPERMRIVYFIRELVQKFIEQYIKPEGGTTKQEELIKMASVNDDLSVQNMAAAILEMRKYFQENPQIQPENLLQFLLNNVLMIFVATEDLDDAFRLFTILNNRGIPLRNSDILKSLNLGALSLKKDKIKYAKMWEEAEGELGDDFERFLQHVRTVLVKEKARSTLLQEFEEKIYEPKEKDKKTGVKKPVLLKKGLDTFKLIERYLAHYRTIMSGQNSDEIGSYEFDNIVKTMQFGLPATDWVPPLLRYFDKFQYKKLLDFLKLLDNKFSADWLGQYTPTDRIEAMNDTIKVIDKAGSANDVINSGAFKFDGDSCLRALEGPVYGRRFATYVLLKLDYLSQNSDQQMHFETLSVEHILPQNPDDESQWADDFSPEEMEELTNLIGNLVLITRRKNSSQGRLDYTDKKKKYFEKCIDTCPNSLRVLNKYSQWTPTELNENQNIVLKMLRKHYGLSR